QGACADPNLPRNQFDRCALRRQHPRHRSVFECLSVSSQVRPSSPPPELVYGGDNYSDAGGPTAKARAAAAQAALLGSPAGSVTTWPDVPPGSAWSKPNSVRRGRVQKTLWPPAPGSRKLAERFGAALLCVRYRHDPAGLRRFTTVELVVDIAPTPRARKRIEDHWLFPLAVGKPERELRATLKRQGAKWVANDGFLYVPGDVVRRLGLEDRICIDRKPKTPRHLRPPNDMPSHGHI
ncbi:MAG: hypothetical protein Q8N44_18020, partial [Rubrivivax sp.]|nr:hypothetical protein [Rubrivivax sp.]